MKKSGKIALGIIIGIVAAVIAVIFLIVHAVLGFLGYKNPVERYYLKLKTDVALEKRYPGHDFDVREQHGWGEYGYSVGIYGTDENGIEFRVQWVEDDMQDKYHEEWNEHFFRGSYKEVFFESMDDAIEGSKDCAFDTDVTFKGIDLYKADDEELEQFAESIADSLMGLYEETGYYDIRINDFHYRAVDEDGTVLKTKDELVDYVIKEVKIDRKLKEDREKRDD